MRTLSILTAAAGALVLWIANEAGPTPDVPTQDAATRPVGDTSFSAGDRLAIINLFGAYARTYDAAITDEWLALFTDQAELRFVHENKILVNGVAECARINAERAKAREAAKKRRRHALNSYVFSSQTDQEASGHLYFQIYSTQSGGAPSVTVTGSYDFTAVKQGNSWKLRRWIAQLDSLPD
jgi:3-phenylpropionate/cinnamic acid dioxygenase small subunit